MPSLQQRENNFSRYISLGMPSFFVFVTFIFANLWHTNS
nr:MAG TPA: hypothetical protein [Caudoviricetes sp.]